MKKKRILALFLAAVSCLSLAVSASAAGTTTRKATDFKDYYRTAWYAEALSAAVDNGLLYGKSSTIIDPNGAMTRAEMAAIINRSFGCYKAADISQYKDVSKSKWYYKDVALAVQMGTQRQRCRSTPMIGRLPTAATGIFTICTACIPMRTLQTWQSIPHPRPASRKPPAFR